MQYNAHTTEAAHERILGDLGDGKHVALVSDAGTPGVSDPGVRLVREARAAGACLEAIPGPSALTAAISIAGFSGNQFTFLGFVPQKKGRQTFFAGLPAYDHPVIFFESTHRIMKTLSALKENLSVNQKVSVARELTKLHEEFVSGTLETVLQYFEDNPEHQRGEFVLLVEKQNN